MQDATRSTTPHDPQNKTITTATFGSKAALGRSVRAMRMQLELPVRIRSSLCLLASLTPASLHQDMTPTESTGRFVPMRRPLAMTCQTFLRMRFLSVIWATACKY